MPFKESVHLIKKKVADICIADQQEVLFEEIKYIIFFSNEKVMHSHSNKHHIEAYEKISFTSFSALPQNKSLNIFYRTKQR
jgi:hypothetical protein